MIACFDVFYRDSQWLAACVVFEDWHAADSIASYTATGRATQDYQAGEFYRRELNPLLAVIDKIEETIETYVIDAYCHLDQDHSPGLGLHLANALQKSAVIIGVAKNRFRTSNHAAEVLRGDSVRPLFVTAIGIDYLVAAEKIRNMHGEHRQPSMLKAVDRLSRS